ncbi:hypothetical protein HYW20_04275 [Candidatus Woesearchaeota archaeon]|nr:hypothetical protein [Candidatus Woesearchaeota archaeon]
MISDVAYLTRSEKKKQILQILEKPKTPTQISKLLKMHRSSASKILLQMEKKQFVKCLNPDDKMARYYQATEKGLKVLKELEEIEK